MQDVLKFLEKVYHIIQSINIFHFLNKCVGDLCIHTAINKKRPLRTSKTFLGGVICIIASTCNCV